MNDTTSETTSVNDESAVSVEDRRTPLWIPDRIEKECDLSPHAQRWLESNGFTPYAEVYTAQRPVDLIGRRGDELRCVELKMGLNQKVMQQAYVLNLVTGDVWCFVGRKPKKNLDEAKRLGLGVAYFDGEKVHELSAPDRARYVGSHYYRQTLERLSEMQPGGVAGMPCVAGVGPAQEVERAVIEYKRNHPKATWREMYQNIPAVRRPKCI